MNSTPNTSQNIIFDTPPKLKGGTELTKRGKLIAGVAFTIMSLLAFILIAKSGLLLDARAKAVLLMDQNQRRWEELKDETQALLDEAQSKLDVMDKIHEENEAIRSNSTLFPAGAPL